MAMATDGGREFLVLFAHHNMYFNMRFQELESVAALLGVSTQELYAEEKPTSLSASMAVLVRLPGGEADAKKICERSVLVKDRLPV
ncbi:TRM11 [Symbiodinium microadriaticum]|nr:TRM11 [Symbiodinium microadriaticum]